MDPLTTGAIAGLAFLSEKIAEKVLDKLVGEGVDKTWSGREKLAAIFRKYAYDEFQTLQLSEEYKPEKNKIRGEIDKLSDFLRRNEEALREIAGLLGESLAPDFGEFSQYRELGNYLAKLKEKFAAETDDLKQLRISAEIETTTGQIEQLKKTILDFAETITKIPNPSEKQERARELFFAGNLDAARILLEDSREEMQDIKSRALAAKSKNEAERANINEILRQTANDYLLLAQSTAASFSNPDRLEDTCRYFENSIECLAFPDNLFSYARFLQDHNRHAQAIGLYRRIIDDFRGEISEEYYAMTLNNLAALHADTQEFAAAEKEYGEALAIRRRLAEANPSAHEPKVAMTLNNLAVLHRNTQEFAAAEKEYGEALAIYRRLAETNPAAYEPDVAMTLGNLAVLHWKTQEFAAAEKEYSEALAIRRRLAKANPAAYKPGVAMTLNNLGILHKTTQEFAAAEKKYGEALAIYRRLAKANPAAYEPDVAMTLNNLGNLHRNTQEFATAEKEFEAALVIRRRLAEANPAAYEPYVANTLNNLGLLHKNTHEFEAALAIYRRLAKTNPAAYEPDVAMTLNNLGNLHADTQKEFAAAEKEYGEALAIRRRLAEANPAAYEPDVVVTLISMAIFFLQGKPDRERSIKLAQEAVKVITPYVERAPYTRQYLQIAEAVLAAWEE